MKIAVMMLVLVGLFVVSVSGQETKQYEYRTWTSAGGSFKVEAKFVDMDGENTVILERKDDQRKIKVQLNLQHTVPCQALWCSGMCVI
jgi:hypothetical protein